MRVLVVGGAGYIGSHMSKMLAENGHEPIICDDLSTGHLAAVQWGKLLHCRISSGEVLEAIFRTTKIDAVMHFAAKSIVAESVSNPLLYYRNNVSETIVLLELMQRYAVDKFVFSSTAAVYGEPQQSLIDESHPCAPINPYGRSKLMVEQMLSDLAKAGRLKPICLRYFNAAGADADGLIGESHHPETHLIPKILRRANGEDIDVRVFGQDYPTPDGTCIRDYIHVNDLCLAHLRALEALDKAEGAQTFNLGNGQGYSVKQIIAAAEEVVGRKLSIPACYRRAGDPAMLVASSEGARNALLWTPRYRDIREIVESAWKWHRNPRF